MCEPYDEARFRARIDCTLHRLQTILKNSRTPKYPTEVSHQYDDKFLLVEFVSNSALAAVVNCLKAMGMTEETFSAMLEWATKRSVRFPFVVFSLPFSQRSVVGSRGRSDGSEPSKKLRKRDFCWVFRCFVVRRLICQGNSKIRRTTNLRVRKKEERKGRDAFPRNRA